MSGSGSDAMMVLPSRLSCKKIFDRLLRREDLLGFFMLFSNDIAVFALAASLLTFVVHFSPVTLHYRIFPAIGASIVVGCIFSAIDAYRRTGDGPPIAAMPFGLNLPDVVNFCGMLAQITPVLGEVAAWKVACAANFFSSCLLIVAGVITWLVSAWNGQKYANATAIIDACIPRTSQAATLAGIAIALISASSIASAFSVNFISLLPLLTVLCIGIYIKRVEYWNSAGGLLTNLPWRNKLAGFYILGIIIFTTAIAWFFHYVFGWDTGVANYSILPPEYPSGSPLTPLNLFDANTIQTLFMYVGVWLPLAVAALVGVVNCVATTKPYDDELRPDVAKTLVWSGCVSAVFAWFGAPFPSTIYLGQPAFHAAGAGCGYSLINAAFIALLTWTGLMARTAWLIPSVALTPILVLIGIDIASEAFTEAVHVSKIQLIPDVTTDDRTSLLPANLPSAQDTLSVQLSDKASYSALFPAVVIGIIPSLAAFAVNHIQQALGAWTIEVATSLASLIRLQQGFVLISLLWSSLYVHVIEMMERAAPLRGWWRVNVKDNTDAWRFVTLLMSLFN